MRKLAILPLALCLLTSSPSAADRPGPAPCDLGRNAALTYWRAFGSIPKTTKEEDDALSARPGVATKLSPEQAADLVKRWSDALYLMRKAADILQCNWGIDYEIDGAETLLPHIVKAHALTRAAAFRARYLWQEEHRKEAAEDLRYALIMARQVGHDGRDSIIEVLVQITHMEKTVQDTAAFLMTDRNSADVLAEVLGDLVNGSTAPLARNAILADKRAFIPWFRRKFVSDRSAAIAAMAGNPDSDKTQARLRQLRTDEVLTFLDELDKQYDEMAAFVSLPSQEFLAKWPTLYGEIKSGENPFAESAADLLRVRADVEAYNIRWAMIRAAIAIRREGEAALGKVLNPGDGKPFEYIPLETDAFRLRSAQPVGVDEIVMTFGHTELAAATPAPAK